MFRTIFLRASVDTQSSIFHPSIERMGIYYPLKDEKYLGMRNFKILGANSFIVAPVMLEIFDAPYRTDLCWLYEIHVETFYEI